MCAVISRCEYSLIVAAPFGLAPSERKSPSSAIRWKRVSDKYKTGHLAWCTFKSLGLCLEQLATSLQLSSPSILTSMEGSLFTQPRGVPDHRENSNSELLIPARRRRTCNPTAQRKIIQNDAPSCKQTQASLCRRVDCHGPSVMRNFTIGVVCVHCAGVSSKRGLSSSPVILIWSSTPAQWMWGGETYGSDSATKGIRTEFKHPGKWECEHWRPTRAYPFPATTA